MRKYICFLMLLTAIVTSCDEGRIYEKEVVVPQEGYVMKITGQLSGADSWPEKYSLVIAGFSDDNEYAVISKVINSNIDSDGNVNVTMSGIKDEVDDVELCVINRLRKRIISFVSIEKESFPSGSDTIYMDAGKLDVSMFEAIQTNAFNTSCIGCHGGNGSAVRNLFLTEGQSYEHMVGVRSKVDSEKYLVNPGNASDSFLPLILEEDGHVAHSHIDILDAKKKSTLVSLIKDWINAGASH